MESSALLISGSTVITFVKLLQRGEKNSLSEQASILALFRVLEEICCSRAYCYYLHFSCPILLLCIQGSNTRNLRRAFVQIYSGDQQVLQVNKTFCTCFLTASLGAECCD